MKRRALFIYTILLSALFLLGNAVPSLSQGTDITSFSFPEEASTADINDINHTVDIVVEYGTNLNGLIATFIFDIFLAV